MAAVWPLTSRENHLAYGMNFGPCFHGMVECLYTDIQSAILSNGNLTNFFDVHRGVRQGPVPPAHDIIRSAVRCLQPSSPNMSCHRRN